MTLSFTESPPYWTHGREITLAELLDAREERWHRQLKLTAQYRQTLICLTLNIPGPVKSFPLARLTFDAGMLAIERELSRHQCRIAYRESCHGGWGFQGIFLTEQDASDCKKWMVNIEETHPLGRIWDIDVLNAQGEKLSRDGTGHPRRACLLCSRPAFVCGRSRRHSARELLEREISLMKTYFSRQLAEQTAGLFTKAMIYEVTTTPKPGLVDRWHNGAHKDMDIGTFIDSAAALFPYYQECALRGISFHGSDYPALFAALRPLGLEAEQTMYQAARHANPHKGLIFSGGIFCAAAAHCYAKRGDFRHEDISAICQKMLPDLSKDFEALSHGQPQTHGEKLYRAYHLLGIRGEAMRGYPTVFGWGWNVFTTCLSHGFPLYKSGQITLLYLIAHSEDTNIIARSSYETWDRLTRKLKNFLASVPIDQLDAEAITARLDAYFMKENISPGGSADLLALVYFLYFLRQWQPVIE